VNKSGRRALSLALNPDLASYPMSARAPSPAPETAAAPLLPNQPRPATLISELSLPPRQTVHFALPPTPSPRSALLRRRDTDVPTHAGGLYAHAARAEPAEEGAEA
jgi:hypothetical protein